MALLTGRDRRAAEAIARIGYCNPFLPERLELERAALGAAFEGDDAIISLPFDGDIQAVFRNFSALRDRAEGLVNRMRLRLLARVETTDMERRMYLDSVLYLLYNRHASVLDSLAQIGTAAERTRQTADVWEPFLDDFRWYLELPELRRPEHYEAGHCFAVFFQIQRAFSHIFECIIGRSRPSMHLRAAVWESIFTHDMGRYTRALYRTMGEIPTLITGESGTGKELVARAIGSSRYIPFIVASRTFEMASESSLHSVNLSALSPTLIESELFGHRKGAFSGAVSDRRGWLETCGPLGTVFLDEIGDLDLSLQVKLLRLLQSRSFERVGDTETRRFPGKFVAATNRDLAQEMQRQTFREDLYYRLCADMVRTPTLREQIADRPGDLRDLTHFIAQRVLTDLPDEASVLADEALEWMEGSLGKDYAWPGNIRELEQCVRNVMVRRCYIPAGTSRRQEAVSAPERLGQAVAAGELNLQDLMRHYVSMIYAAEGQYDLAAKRLGIDWRTLKQRLDGALVATYARRE